jgi:SNF2 family DNA or RNA helicase
VLFIEPDWVPSANYQAMKRAHRIGQTLPVHASFAVLSKSLDVSIMRTIERKTRDLSEILD